jgi:hypothetical protein
LSRRTGAKQARRKKRRAVRDANWVPESVLNEVSGGIELTAELERIDERITERGWTFDDELSDDESAIWFYPPSGAEVGDEMLQPVTTIFMSATDDGDVVHVVLVGTAEDFQFTPDEVLEHLDAIEAYRVGDPRPVLPWP